MSQPTQVKFVTPNNDWAVIDNSAAPSVTTGFNAGTLQGYDTTAPGAVAQGTNPFGDTGSVLIDASGNDTAYLDPSTSTVVGNPVSNVTPTAKTVTKVLTNPLSATINWKNPS
jgi:hypothetical protein